MHDTNDHDERQQGLEDFVQDRDVRARGILFAGFLILLLIMASFAIPVALYTYLSGQDEPVAVSPQATPDIPPAPRLQVDEYQEWEQISEAQKSLIDDRAWGYIDQQAGRARIPVERAMDIMVQRGLPVRQGFENFPIDEEGFAEPEAADWNSGHIVESGR